MSRLVRVFEERPVRFTVTLFGGVLMAALALSAHVTLLTAALLFLSAAACVADLFIPE
jgi:hypothetical protein